MMMARIPRLNRERLLAVVDIGSGHVGCAIISIPTKGSGKVLGHARSKLILEERTVEQSRARIAEEVTEASKAALDVALSAHAGLHISAVYAILHAPWTSSKTFTAAASYEKNVLIRHQAIAQLAQDALASDGGVDRAHVLEASVLTVRLNGYPTDNPDGMRAHTAEVVAIASAYDAGMKTSAESALERAFPAAVINWRSAARVNTIVLQHFADTSDALVVNVGVLATHIMVLRDGIPIAERAVPEGLKSILTRVHGERPAEEVLGLFRMLARDACADDACTALEASMARAEPELAKIFGEHLGALAQERRLPNTLILIVHPDIAQWLSNFFERIDFTQFTITTLPFTSQVADSAQLREWAVWDEAPDAVLAFGAAYTVLEQQST